MVLVHYAYRQAHLGDAAPLITGVLPTPNHTQKDHWTVIALVHVHAMNQWVLLEKCSQ